MPFKNQFSKCQFFTWRRTQASLALVSLLITQWAASLELVWAQVTSLETKTPLVAILVEDRLLQDGTLKSHIYRYAEDVQRSISGQALVVPMPVETSVKDIYEGLASWYWSGYDYDPTTKLEGVVLIGDVPLPVVDKGGRLWPTIFPYVDFEAPAYVWDDEAERFVYKPTRQQQAEIWHGLIRASSDTPSTAREELRQYFEQNHRVHSGEVTYDKKVLHANLKAQKEVLPIDLLDRYRAWLEHVDDVQYLRFTKHLANELRATDTLFTDNPLAQMTEADRLALADSIAAATGESSTEVNASLAGTAAGEMPDIYSKYLIDQLLTRYQDLYRHWLTQINDQVQQAGRWDPIDVDTLPTLVSWQDEATSLLLRKTNDQIEDQLMSLVATANLAHRPWVQENTDVQYYEDDGLGGRNYFTVSRPNYWNGVPRDDNFTVENCTLHRGNVRSDAYPTAQQVEANRTFDPTTAGSCAAPSAPTADQEADLYEGCCATNLLEQNGVFSYLRCDTGSQWNSDEGLASVIHQGAELPVFDLGGTNETQINQHGAAGCLPIIETTVNEADAHRFSTLMLHQEPTPETLQAQLEAQTTRALPVDDPRGFSFLDHGLTPHRIDFLDLFLFRDNLPASLAEFEEALLKKADDKITALNQIITTGNTASADALSAFQAGCAGTFTQSVFDGFTTRAACDSDVRFFETAQTIPTDSLGDIIATLDLEALYQALVWLDRSVDSKNTEVLKLGLSANTAWALLNPEFGGYEVAQFVADGTAQTVELGFNPETLESDQEFLSAVRQQSLIGLDTEPLTFAGYNFADTFLHQEGLDTCAGISDEVLSWSEKLECELKQMPLGGTLDLFVPELGQVDKTRAAVITDPDKPLADKILRITPDTVVVHNQAVDPIPVTVVVTDAQNRIQKDIVVDEVSLRFSSPSVAEFFSVFPSETTKLTNGRASFWLVPKTQGYGGQFALLAEARQGETQLLSAKVPLRVTRHRLQLTTTKPITTVQNTTGLELRLSVLDADNQLSGDWLGKTLEAEVVGGILQGGNDIKLSDVTVPLRFFPGDKKGEARITITDPAGELMSDELIISLEPEPAAALELKSDKTDLVPGSGPITITAQVTDSEGNALDFLLHEYTWRVEGAEVIDEALRDEDPRRSGVQETMAKGQSQLQILPVKSEVRVEVISDKLPKAGRSLQFQTITNPQIEITTDTDSVIAGESLIEADIMLTDQTGAALVSSFTGQLSIPHLEVRQPISFRRGTAKVLFNPGTVAGDFVAEVSLPGFPAQLINYKVAPGPATVLDLSSADFQTTYPADQGIEVVLSARDAFGNPVIGGGQVIVKASDQTNHLVAPIGQIGLEGASTTLRLEPTGKTGSLRLIASQDGLTSGTLALELTESLSRFDIQQLSPQALLSLWLGFPSGDVLQPNIAEAVLHAGNTQAVGSLIAPPNPGKSVLRLSVFETVLDAQTSLRLMSDSQPRFQLWDRDTKLTEMSLNFGNNVPLYVEKNRQGAGVYFDPTERFQDSIIQSNRMLAVEQTPFLRVENAGGVHWLHPDIEVRMDTDITAWQVYLKDDLLGTLQFYLPQATVAPELEGLGLRLEKPTQTDFVWEPTVTGNHHLSPPAWNLIDASEVETLARRLGSPQISVENADDLGVGWTAPWKPGTLLAAGNVIGEATRIGASDLFLLYGDPTLSLDTTQNQSNTTGMRLDTGRAVWTAPHGTIDGLLSGSFSDTNTLDVLVQSENRFRRLQPVDSRLEKWQDRGEFLVVDEAIAETVLLKNNLNGDEPSMDDLAILDTEGRVRVYDISTGNWRVTPTALTDIQWLAAGKFNTDNETDLAFVDDQLNLAIAFRQGSSFAAPVYVDSLAPNFNTITESNTDESVSYLATTWIHYQGVENLPITRQFQSINIPAEVAKPLDLDQIAETLNTAYRGGSGTLTNRKNFVEVVYDPTLNTTFTLRGPGEILNAGDRLTAQLSLRSDTTRTDAEIMLPEDWRFTLDKASLRCSGCATKPKIYASDGFGAAWVYLDTLPGRQTITLSWDYEVEALVLEETVAVLDKDEDGLDDLLVVRGDQLVQFLSRDQNYGAGVIPSLDADVAPDYQGVATTEDLSQDVGTSSTQALADSLQPFIDDTDLLNTEVFGRLSADPDGDGIPDHFDAYPDTNNALGIAALAGSLATQKENYQCGFGDCFNFPVSQAFLAPGLVTKYQPPVAAPSGEKKKGKPAVSWPTPKQETSKGRLYLTPTTTGHLGVSVCLGSYKTHMTDPAWAPNCSVVTPKIDFMGTCSAEGSGQNLASLLPFASNQISGQGVSLMQVGQNTPRLSGTAGIAPNKNIAGVDLLSDWVKGQMAEFTTFTMGLPTIKTKFNDRTVEKKNKATSVPQNALEAAEAELGNYPFVRLKREAITLPYPSLAGPDLDKFADEFTNWKQELEDSSLFDVGVAELEAQRQRFTQSKEDLEKMANELNSVSFKAVSDDVKAYSAELKNHLLQLEADYERLCAAESDTNNCLEAAKSLADFKKMEQQLESWKQGFAGLNLSRQQQAIAQYGQEAKATVESLQKIKDLRVSAEALKTSADTNLETLKSYKAIPEKLSTIPADAKKMLSMSADGVQHMHNFMETYSKDLQGRLGQWQEAYELTRGSLSAFDSSVLAPLVQFNNSCRTCAVDRGTSLGWLLQVMLGAVDLPVFKLPTFADIDLDFTNLDLGLSMTIPDKINYQPVDIQLTDLPSTGALAGLAIGSELQALTGVNVPDVTQALGQVQNLQSQVRLAETFMQNLPTASSWPRFDSDGNWQGLGNQVLPNIVSPTGLNLDLDLPTLPTFPAITVEMPELPHLPQISVPETPLSVPALTLPQLATLPSAPQLPLSFISGIESVVQLPMSFLDLFCMMRLGSNPVPEWYVKPYVEQLTNRSELSLGLDFPNLSLKNYQFGRESISLGAGLPLGSVFSSASSLVNSVGQVGTTLIQTLSTDRHAGQPSQNIPLPLEQNLPWTLPIEWLDLFSWAKETRERHLASRGVMLSLDEFKTALRDRLGQSEATTLAQQELVNKVLALDTSPSSNVNLPAAVAQNLAAAEVFLGQHAHELNQDLLVLEELLEKPWSQWEDHPAVQARDRFLATTEPNAEYESYVRPDLAPLVESVRGSTAIQQTNGTVTPALPLLENTPAVDNTAEVQAGETVPEPGLYYVSQLDNRAELFTAYRPQALVEMLLTDHNADDAPEIWWSEGAVLYLKVTGNPQPLSVERSVITLSTKKFIDYYVPGSAPETAHWFERQTLGFDDLDFDLNYWEWVQSDHHDIISDIQKRPNTRLARTWHRFAFTDREALKTNGILIDYLTGSPTFTDLKGTSLEVTAGSRLNVDFSIELGPEDQVELTLPDGSGVSVLGGEYYELRGVRKGQRFTRLQLLSDQPGFGLLIGIREDKRSHLLGPFHHPVIQP